MAQLLEYAIVALLTFTSFIGIVAVHLGRKKALIFSIMLSIGLIFWNEHLQEETGRGIAGNLYCALLRCSQPRTADRDFSPARPVPAESGEVVPASPVGVWGSNFGPVQINHNGGTFRDGAGSLVADSFDGRVMRGKWQRAPGYFDGTCSDGRFWGRFVFYFDARSFAGRWGKCDSEPTDAWDGWRPVPVFVTNDCDYAVDVYLRWADALGNWQSNGPWSVPARTRVPLRETFRGADSPVLGSSEQSFAFVTRSDGAGIVLEGSSTFVVQGVSRKMSEVRGSRDATALTFSACAAPTDSSFNVS